MNLTFDRRFDKWEDLRAARERCDSCMYDAPYEYCCKNQCGGYTWCKDCEAESRDTSKLCEK